MNMIRRDDYLKQLISAKSNGLIKIITGIRRCGKSFLLDPIFTDYLKGSDVDENHIIKINFDERKNARYLNPDTLDSYLRKKVEDDKTYYFLLDEIQLVDNFESVLNGLLHLKNVDIYVTGSNSKFLSSDIVTEFRGRGTQIKVYPLSFKEYLSTFNGNKEEAFASYIIYGGMPQICSLKLEKEKAKYLKELFDLTYTKDIIDRNNIKKDDIFESLIDVLASSIGSLTNPSKITNTFISNGYKGLSKNTIIQYLSYLLDSFLVEKVMRFDIKGKKYISSPSKYYFADVGLRNARLNFRQLEENHIMENVIYLELARQGFNVDVGVVEINESNKRKQLEIDFVCNQGNKRYYIQSALNLETREKTIQEVRPFINISDGFKKVIIVKGEVTPWYTEEGILVVGMINFLTNSSCLDF
ncbi:MAG: ATP-binding protein [Bacilli bacterium]|nr:ATP-binding protein [Bacilli bacterium]MDD3069116.1 ATP-binding protein [Bacilli bacterium]MDD3841529.1 ATP-binding protein [Bacilli bacterium]